MNEQVIKQLVNSLAVHHTLLMAHGVLFHRLRVSTQEYVDAVKECSPKSDVYKLKILSNLLGDAPPQNEKDLWESLGLGDLWGPSAGHEPDEGDQPV